MQWYIYIYIYIYIYQLFVYSVNEKTNLDNDLKNFTLINICLILLISNTLVLFSYMGAEILLADKP